MPSINALSLTPYVNAWLADSRDPRILHIFDRACNLINERKEILSVVTPEIGNGPFNLVVGDDIYFSDHLDLESSISIFPTRLTLGNLNILIENMRLWNPRPDWGILHSKRVEILHQVTQLRMTHNLNHRGFDRPFGGHSRFLNHQGLSIAQSLVSNLSVVLIHVDNSSVSELASQLAGVGIGLTPSGDDFLMGAIHAIWIIHPPEVAKILAQTMADIAAPRTTALSAAWLRSAARGEAGILWHEFFNALASSDIPRMRKTMESILAVGETSGADALAGFTHIFISLTKGPSHG